MSYNNNDISCQVCNAYLFDEDDVVFCPVCGAPHHRECYNSIGHCALEQLHGTAEQYDIKNAAKQEAEPITESDEPKSNDGVVKCSMCEQEYNIQESRCPNCGTPNISKIGGYAVIDFLGGVDPQTDLGEGVKADDAKKFVFANSGRYMPRFLKMKQGRKVSWNWFAFLLPGPWLLSRKMYSLGALFCAISLVSDMFSLPLYDFIAQKNLQGFSDIYAYIGENLSAINPLFIILAYAGLFLSITSMVICGMFGDYFYYKHVLSGVNKIKSTVVDSEEDRNELWRKNGSVSLIATFIGLFVINILPNIISSFLI